MSEPPVLCSACDNFADPRHLFRSYPVCDGCSLGLDALAEDEYMLAEAIRRKGLERAAKFNRPTPNTPHGEVGRTREILKNALTELLNRNARGNLLGEDCRCLCITIGKVEEAIMWLDKVKE